MTSYAISIGAPSTWGAGLGTGAPRQAEWARDLAKVSRLLGRAATRGGLSKIERAALVRAVGATALRATPLGRALTLAFAAYELTNWAEPIGESTYPLWWNLQLPSAVWEVDTRYAKCPTPPTGATGWGTKQTPYMSLPTGTCSYRLTGTNSIDQGSPRIASGVAYWATIWTQPISGGKYYWGRVSYKTKTGGYTAVPALPKADANLNPVIVQPIPAAAISDRPTITVPHRVVRNVNAWRDLVQPREDGRPIRDNGTVARPVERPDIGVGVVITPGGVKEGEPHRPRPPKKGEKEKKAIASTRTGRVLQFALRRAGDATEALDLIESVYYALPRDLQSRKDKMPHQKLQTLYKHWDQVRVDQAVKNILLTEAMDRGMAKASEPLQRAFRRHLPKREMPLFGPLV